NRAKIVDFGLVRSTARPAGTTQEGTTPGTPEYMSPEQVREPDRIDQRSDVYSLGVTLYETLTGEVPFRGVPHLVQQQVLSDEPRPPRRLNDKIPRDLETICLKAMAKAPGRRDPTAQEMRDDLQRWLEGEPIRAQRVGAVGKVWRWCHRKPAVASLAAALVLTVASGFAGVTWQWWRAEAHARKENEQRLLAERSRDVVRRLVREYSTTLEAGLSKEPGTHALRKKLLEAALAHNRAFLPDSGDDPFIQADGAAAHYRVAAILSQLGRRDEALAECNRGLAIFEKLHREHPDDTDFQANLARGYSILGTLLFNHQPDESLH